MGRCSSVLFRVIWDKVFKNGPSKIFYGISSTNFTWSILEYFAPYGQIPIPSSDIEDQIILESI